MSHSKTLLAFRKKQSTSENKKIGNILLNLSYKSVMENLSTAQIIIDSKSKDLGGFIVRRALPSIHKRMVGPFVFFDHMGPVDFIVGQGLDVRPHPHIGLSTLTYLFEGSILHKDTLGYEQLIQPGAVNWMTAGRGIAHSERSSQEARKSHQRLHGIQTWLALPKTDEETEATFHHHPEKEIPEISDQGFQLRVIAGNYGSLKSPVQVFSQVTYFDLQMMANTFYEWQHPSHELAVYIVSGCIQIGNVTSPLQMGQLAVLETGKTLRIHSLEKSQILILGGEKLPEERHVWWNFVSSSKERIEKAKQQWQQQSFGSIAGETEFIPLPST